MICVAKMLQNKLSMVINYGIESIGIVGFSINMWSEYVSVELQNHIHTCTYVYMYIYIFKDFRPYLMPRFMGGVSADKMTFHHEKADGKNGEPDLWRVGGLAG